MYTYLYSSNTCIIHHKRHPYKFLSRLINPAIATRMARSVCLIVGAEVAIHEPFCFLLDKELPSLVGLVFHQESWKNSIYNHEPTHVFNSAHMSLQQGFIGIPYWILKTSPHIYIYIYILVNANNPPSMIAN